MIELMKRRIQTLQDAVETLSRDGDPDNLSEDICARVTGLQRRLNILIKKELLREYASEERKKKD